MELLVLVLLIVLVVSWYLQARDNKKFYKKDKEAGSPKSTHNSGYLSAYTDFDPIQNKKKDTTKVLKNSEDYQSNSLSWDNRVDYGYETKSESTPDTKYNSTSSYDSYSGSGGSFSGSGSGSSWSDTLNSRSCSSNDSYNSSSSDSSSSSSSCSSSSSSD